MTNQSSKDGPYYDWFPERFWFAVEGWPDRDIVVYKRLLDQQWLRDGLPADLEKLARIARKKLSNAVISKFPVSADGLRRNPRMEEVRARHRDRKRISLIGNKNRWNREDNRDDLGTENGSHQGIPNAVPSAVPTSLPKVQPMHIPSVLLPPSSVQSLSPKSGTPSDANEAGGERERFFVGKQKLQEGILAAYPVNGDRFRARVAVAQALGTEFPETILRAVEAHAAKFAALPESAKRFCPGLHTYFEGGRWRDDPAAHPWTVAQEAVKAQRKKPAMPPAPAIPVVAPEDRPSAGDFQSAKKELAP